MVESAARLENVAKKAIDVGVHDIGRPGWWRRSSVLSVALTRHPPRLRRQLPRLCSRRCGIVLKARFTAVYSIAQQGTFTRKTPGCSHQLPQVYG